MKILRYILLRMGIMYPKKCLLCHSGDHRTIFSYTKPDQYEVAVGVSQKGYFRKWVRCKQCGFYYSIYSRPRNILDKIYTAAYREKNALWRKESPEETFRRIMALPEEESETKLRVNWIKKIINNIWKSGLLKQGVPPYRALDIGGGAGIFAHEFQNDVWKNYIIDPGGDSDFIQKKLHIPFMRRRYKPRSFNREFNLVSLIYVLEHLLSPASFLRSLRNDMAKNSFLFIEVPDSLCFRFKSMKDDIFNSCHLWMFDPETLTCFLSYCGFEVFSLCRLKTMRGHYALMALAGKKII